MSLDRRNFLGAFAAGSASLALPRARTGAMRLAPVPANPIVLPAPGRPSLLQRALAALDAHSGRITERGVIGVVDFAAPSHAMRMQLVDVAGGRVIAEHLVAHGHGSDPDNSGWVERFSNRPGSNASSEGAFLAADLYTGEHGRSRRLIGLDPENSLAYERAIVIHAARYVDPAMARTHGRIGRSQGCFAVSPGAIGEVLARLGPGHLLYAGKLT